MAHYYKFLSNYTNVGNGGHPDSSATEANRRQLALVREVLPPGRAYEIGCATGFTLHELKKLGWVVSGCDPSPSAARVANALYGIQIQVGHIEDLIDDLVNSAKVVDLVLILHVLEHVHQPVEFLKAAAKLLGNGGYLLVEVPCLMRPEMWPNGYFTFEHINVFSANSLQCCLSQAGFHIKVIKVHGDTPPYPVITVLAKTFSIRFRW
jgi:SAM-dependent methyltransferase